MIFEFADYFLGWAQYPLGRVHFAFALLALVTGPVIFYSGKGTSFHKWTGYVYAISMLLLNVTALMSYTFSGGFNFFHAAAIGSLATLVPAFLFILKAKKSGKTSHYAAHGILMGWTYFGLMGAFVAEAFTRQVPWMLHGDGGWIRFLSALSVWLILTGLWTHRRISKTVPAILRTQS